MEDTKPNVEQPKSEDAPKFVYKKMDTTNILMVLTEDETVKTKIIEQDEKKEEPDPNFYDIAANSDTREPAFVLGMPGRTESTYPIRYLLWFLKLADRSGATHIKLNIGKGTPIMAEFELPVGAIHKKTRAYVAPYVSSD